MERVEGIGPFVYGLEDRNSTIELYPQLVARAGIEPAQDPAYETSALPLS
jgi:hypothetical protein